MGLKQNMISNVVLTTSTIFISFVTFPYVTRTLSPQSMGNVLFVDAFTQYFILFSSLGIPFYGVREIAKLKENVQEQYSLINSLVSLQVALSIFYSIIFFGLTIFIPSLANDLELVSLGCLTILVTSFSIEWYYQGSENFAYITKRSLLIRILSVAAIFVLVKKQSDYLIYYLILFAVSFFNSLLNFGNYLFKLSGKFRYTLQFKTHIRPLAVLFSINLSVSVYVIMDTIILGLLTDATSVSYYSIPLKLVKMVWVVVGGFSVVLIPRVSGFFQEGNLEEAANLLKKSLNLVFLLTLPFAFLCFFFAKEILFTVFGTKYLAAEMSLQILCVVPLIIGVCNVFGTQFLLPIGKEKNILHATIFGLVTSLLLNFLLIPHLKYIGSSIACVAAEAVVCIYIFWKAKSQITINMDFALLKLIVLSSVLTLILGIVLRMYISNAILLCAVCTIYISIFTGLQVLIFNNQFVNSLIKFKSSSNG